MNLAGNVAECILIHSLIHPSIANFEYSAGDGERLPDFLLLDVNAFPGYEKLPNYEELYVTYLKSLLLDNKSQEQKLTRFVVCPKRTSEEVSPR